MVDRCVMVQVLELPKGFVVLEMVIEHVGRLVNVLVLLEFYLEMVIEVGSGMVNVLVVQQKVVIEGGRWVMNVVMLL